MKPLYLSVIAVTSIAVGTNAHAATIVNGSFEAPALSPGSVPGYAIGSTAITGWTVVANNGSTTNNGHDIAVVTNGNQFALATPFGSQFLDLTGYADQPAYSGVAQTLTTVANQAYVVSFWLGASTSDTRYTGPVSVNISVGSNSASIFNNGTTTQTSGTTLWTLQTFAFTATGTSTVLSIVGNSATGGQFIGLDNVSISDAVAAVPEPASWAMMIAGFGLVGGMRRRRRVAVRFA